MQKNNNQVHGESNLNEDQIKDANRVMKKYDDLVMYEREFDKAERDCQKLASVWLLLTFGAIAYIVRGDVGVNSILRPKLLLCVVAFLGSIGLLVLWVLDQKVYHRLLGSPFMLRLRMEYLYTFIPPTASLMMINSDLRGMSFYRKFYYLVPIIILSGINLTFCIWHLMSIQFSNYLIESMLLTVICFLNLIIPLWLFLMARKMEPFEEIAEKFDDVGYSNHISSKSYVNVLRRWDK